VTKEETLIIEGRGKKARIESRIKSIQNRIEQESSEFSAEELRKRLGKLSGGVAVINVGAATETELKEKKMRIDEIRSELNIKFINDDNLMLPVDNKILTAKNGN